MEFNLSWALYESLELELQRLVVNNYGRYTLTIVIKKDINGLEQNCGIRIFAIHNDSNQLPETITIDCYGIVENQINN